MPSRRERLLDNREIATPFRIGQDGGVAYVTSDKDRASQHINAIATTNHNERVMRPGYGADIASQLFEPADPLMMREIVENVREAVTTFEPQVTLLSVTALPSESSPEEVVVNINYSVPFATGVFTMKSTVNTGSEAAQ